MVLHMKTAEPGGDRDKCSVALGLLPDSLDSYVEEDQKA
jgi:hypothetical protein